MSDERQPLEERAIKAGCNPGCRFPKCHCKFIPKVTRVVLALVRQEQEKDATEAMTTAAEFAPDHAEPDLEDSWSNHGIHNEHWRAMIRAWWKEHDHAL